MQIVEKKNNKILGNYCCFGKQKYLDYSHEVKFREHIFSIRGTKQMIATEYKTNKTQGLQLSTVFILFNVHVLIDPSAPGGEVIKNL